jgi:hypothetical protein
MMPISRRRAKVASRIVLPICSAEASRSRADAPAGRPLQDVQRAEERVEQLVQVLDLLDALEPDHRADHALVLLRVAQLDPERLLHLVDLQRVLDRAALVRPLELLPGLLLGLEVDAVGRDLGLVSRGRRMTSFCAWRDVLAGLALVAAGVLGAQEDRDLDLVVPAALHQVTCWLASRPAPNRDSDTHMVMITARVMVRF